MEKTEFDKKRSWIWNGIDFLRNSRSLFIVFLLMLSHVAAIEIVNIGCGCNVARAARLHHLRHTAYPLDWMITSLESIKEAFQDDFVHVLMPEQLRESDDHKSVIDGYGFIYIHDFPTVRYPIAPEDDEIMPVHELTSNWRDSIPIVQAKFHRRLQRLFKLLHEGEPVALVRYGEMGRIEAEEFIKLLQNKFPNAKLVLVVIGSAIEFQQAWNLPHVCNIYIDEKDYRAWDGPAWAEAMQKIAALNPESWGNSFTLTYPIYNPGFFCAFNTVIGALDEYDRGVISGLSLDFGNKGWYYEAAHGNNWWEYYFEPLVLGKTPERLFPTYQKISYAYDAQFNMPPQRASELIQKYIRVKPHIIQQINDFYDQYLDCEFLIGVHYRGTDKIEAEPVPYESVIDMLDNLLREHTKAKIFISTDDDRFAAYIKRRLGNQIVMRDALRSDNGIGIHMRQELNAYKKGEDAIIDCLLLSRCSLLIKMASYLSDCSIQFNPNIQVIKLNKSFSE
jgi:Putative papain-like cysteine peptidase (DUF1796)